MKPTMKRDEMRLMRRDETRLMRRIKIFAVLMVLALWGLFAFGSTTYTVTPSQSAFAIQTVIYGASAGDTVSFAAGTFNISQGLTLKCGITYTGPVATPATAILNGTFTRESTSIFNLYPGSGYAAPCTTPTTIEYLHFENEGGVYVQSSFSNITVTHNQFSNLPCCSNVAHDVGIFFDGGNNHSAQTLTNATATYNTIGDSSSCTSPQNAMTSYASPETIQGNCAGIVTTTNINGLVIEYNVIGPVGEGVHIECYGNTCEPPNGPTVANVTAMYNDFVGIHRISWEQQPQVTSNMVFEYNSEHDATNPYFGNFALSFACCDTGATSPGIKVLNNVLIQNTAPHVRYGYGIEAWGLNGIYSNNLIQGLGSPQGISWCYGMAGGTVSNNTVQGPNYSSGSDPSGGNGYIGNENINNGGSTRCGSNPPWSPSTVSGNVTGATPSVTTSQAPSISPAAGSYASPLTVTLTDAGFTSGAVPQGNTSIYYTTDGTTPVPGSGTTQLYTSPLILTLPVTLKAVGMWGSGANTLHYPSGYGFVPSAVQTATYTSGGVGVSLSSVSVSATGGVSTLNVGTSVQMIATCHYSNGATTGCNTTDSYGNQVIAWNSSSGAVTMNGAGLANGASIGTATITATVTGGMSSSTPYGLTVSASPLTLSSVSLATAGGVSSVTAGTTNQLIATCFYSDGSSDICGGAVDAHGNVVNSWTSSAPTAATVTGSGYVTGQAAGNTNLSAIVLPSPAMLGTNVEDTTGYTNNGYINEIYGVTGTSAGQYTPGNCNIYIPATTWTAGKLWTCLLVVGTPTTQQSSALCSNSYTLTGSSWPGGNITISMASCPKLPPDQGYWLGSTTNQTATSPAQGFTKCGGSCSGPAPAFGSGSYAYRYVANPFGNYTSLPTTLNATSGGQQVSQYLTLTTTPVSSANLPLTVKASPPALVSAYLTGSTSSLTVGGTVQMAAKCHYTSGPDQDCTVADIYGDAVTQWNSSDATLAAVGAVGSSNAGLVTAVAAGMPGVTATINGGLTSSSYVVTITSPVVTLTNVSLATTGGATSLAIGGTNQLQAICTYSDGSTTACNTTDVHGNQVSGWISSNVSLATVSGTGLVTAVAAGLPSFTATAGGHTSAALALSMTLIPTGRYVITIKGPVTITGTVQF